MRGGTRVAAAALPLLPACVAVDCCGGRNCRPAVFSLTVKRVDFTSNRRTLTLLKLLLLLLPRRA